MAQLSSPGVSVTVIDESFYTPAAAGTVPLIIVASAESKQNGAGTGTAPGTLKANAGKVYLLTSQKDLSDTFGIPKFITDANNNPVHGGEQNEYGLEAAYSFLGVSNRAYVVRADLDVGQLNASSNSPTGAPEDGTFWFDTADTKFGVFEWDSNPATATGGQSFTVQQVTVITDNAKVNPSTKAPLPSIGAIGDYAIVSVTTLQKLWMKKYKTDTAAGTWVEVGKPSWTASWPTASGTASNPALLNTDTLIVNGYSLATGFTSLSTLVTALGSHVAGVTAAVINNKLYLYSTGVDITISGTAVAKVGLSSTTYKAPKLQLSPHYTVPTYKITDNVGTANGYPTGSIWVKTTSPNLGADWAIKKYNATSATWLTQSVKLFSDNAKALAGLDANGGGINLAIGTVYVKYNDDEGTPAEANFKIYGRSGVGATVITSSPVGSGTFTSGQSHSFTVRESLVGNASYSSATTVTFTAAGTADDADALLTAFTAALPNSNLVATKTTTNQIVISHQAGGDFNFVDGANLPVGKIFSVSTTANFYIDPVGTANYFVATLWTPVVPGTNTAFAVASPTPPTKIPADHTLWYNSIVDEVDILVHNGTTWVGYLNYTQNQAGGDRTDPAGPIVSATQPTKQSDGTPLANGDLWISTADLENYPQVYKYNYLTKKWVLVDSTDQTSENGILFHDARWSGAGDDVDPDSIAKLLTYDFLDFDAPDPALYPKGMLLWNLRRSGFNVKKFVQNYVDTTARNHRQSDEQMNNYYPHRWLSEAANQEDGSGTFGRHAQRKVVLTALQATINANQEIRDEESRVFNLIACPGYPEAINEMVGLNTDRGLTAFIVGDTPARLTPDATTLSNWGNNVAGALEDNDKGLVTTNPYLGVFYPWGYTSDLLGNNIVVPPSHIMLRTISLSDNVSYPWFAPAGTRRGGITNASSVGYINSATGEFQSVALNTGQRDTLASIHVNPLTYITGTGLVNYGQKTRQLSASSLDRINVARLVVYLRRQLSELAKPYIFEPNDTITRNEIKQAAEKLLLELVGQRAIYDYLVVCDTSNNTPARIDRSELYLDIAIEPVKAVEFIYIPLRLKNTGAIKGLGGV
jgi:hypothetical protein